MYFFPIELIVTGILCAAVGYVFGLRETKRRLKAHQEVTDRLMGRTPGDMSGGFSGSHDDKIDAAALSGMVYPTYGGVSRSASPFAASLGNNANKALGGAAMQNQATYSATPSKFASIARKIGGPSATGDQRSEFRKKLYEELKKAMESPCAGSG